MSGCASVSRSGTILVLLRFAYPAVLRVLGWLALLTRSDRAKDAAALRLTGGLVGDRLFLKSDKDPAHFVEAASRLVPDVPVKVISRGEPLTVAP